MMHFIVDGKFVIRLVVDSAATEMCHVRDVWELPQRLANDVLQRPES
jgi:aromatic-L-amino-acid/L-tryptophan decarboxylase